MLEKMQRELDQAIIQRALLDELIIKLRSQLAGYRQALQDREEADAVEQDS